MINYEQGKAPEYKPETAPDMPPPPGGTGGTATIEDDFPFKRGTTVEVDTEENDYSGNRVTNFESAPESVETESEGVSYGEAMAEAEGIEVKKAERSADTPSLHQEIAFKEGQLQDLADFIAKDVPGKEGAEKAHADLQNEVAALKEKASLPEITPKDVTLEDEPEVAQNSAEAVVTEAAQAPEAVAAPEVQNVPPVEAPEGEWVPPEQIGSLELTHELIDSSTNTKREQVNRSYDARQAQSKDIFDKDIAEVRKQIKEQEAIANSPEYSGEKGSVEENISKLENEVREIEQRREAKRQSLENERTEAQKAVEREDYKARERMYSEKISQATSFPELHQALENVRELRGSEQSFSGRYLSDMIENVRIGAHENYLTHAGGLREKVLELMEKEGAQGTQENAAAHEQEVEQAREALRQLSPEQQAVVAHEFNSFTGEKIITRPDGQQVIDRNTERNIQGGNLDLSQMQNYEATFDYGIQNDGEVVENTAEPVVAKEAPNPEVAPEAAVAPEAQPEQAQEGTRVEITEPQTETFSTGGQGIQMNVEFTPGQQAEQGGVQGAAESVANPETGIENATEASNEQEEEKDATGTNVNVNVNASAGGGSESGGGSGASAEGQPAQKKEGWFKWLIKSPFRFLRFLIFGKIESKNQIPKTKSKKKKTK